MLQVSVMSLLAVVLVIRMMLPFVVAARKPIVIRIRIPGLFSIEVEVGMR